MYHLSGTNKIKVKLIYFINSLKGHRSYLITAEKAFDSNIDHPQLVKMYGGSEGKTNRKRNIARLNVRAQIQQEVQATQTRNLLLHTM